VATSPPRPHPCRPNPTRPTRRRRPAVPTLGDLLGTAHAVMAADVNGPRDNSQQPRRRLTLICRLRAGAVTDRARRNSPR
jgi:hypothetical protein